MYTTVAKGKKLLKIPKREESLKKKSHSVHLWHCSFYTWCHSKLPFLFTCIFFSLSANNLSKIFLWIIQQVDLVREREFLSTCFQQEHIPWVLPTVHLIKQNSSTPMCTLTGSGELALSQPPATFQELQESKEVKLVNQHRLAAIGESDLHSN